MKHWRCILKPLEVWRNCNVMMTSLISFLFIGYIWLYFFANCLMTKYYTNDSEWLESLFLKQSYAHVCTENSLFAYRFLKKSKIPEMLCRVSPYLKYMLKTLNNRQYWFKEWLLTINHNISAFLDENKHDCENLEKVLFQKVVTMATSY